MEVPGHTTWTDKRRAEVALRDMVSKLNHLDLTEHILFENKDLVAHGGFSDVFIGYIESKHLQHHLGSPNQLIKVAIKRLRIRLGKDEKLTKSLAREMGIWAKLRHRNVLPFMGFVLKNEYPALVSEWIENGTVMEYLKSNSSYDVAHLARGVARGLEYLHNSGIIHSDLKSGNILISGFGEPLICDFGLSRMLDSSQSLFVSTSHDGFVKGSVRWMAVELLNPENGVDPKHSKETDIWAYGMTLYELITKGLPYSQLKSNLHVLFAVIKGELPTKPDSSDVQDLLPVLWPICMNCWNPSPKDRINIGQIVGRLRGNAVPLTDCRYVDNHYPKVSPHDDVGKIKQLLIDDYHYDEENISALLDDDKHLKST